MIANVPFDKITSTFKECIQMCGKVFKPTEAKLTEGLLAKGEQKPSILEHFLIRLVAVVFCFSAMISISWADEFSCGEWSNSSLQHKGSISISISIDNDTLTWSNGKNSYEARLIQSDTPQLAYSDAASLYMLFGVFSIYDKLYSSGYLRIRRIFFIEEVLKVSEIECLINP